MTGSCFENNEQTLKDREQILIGEANCSFFREAKLVQELEESRRLLKKHTNSYSKYIVWFVFFVLCFSLWVAVIAMLLQKTELLLVHQMYG